MDQSPGEVDFTANQDLRQRNRGQQRGSWAVPKPCERRQEEGISLPQRLLGHVDHGKKVR